MTPTLGAGKGLSHEQGAAYVACFGQRQPQNWVEKISTQHCQTPDSTKRAPSITTPLPACVNGLSEDADEAGARVSMEQAHLATSKTSCRRSDGHWLMHAVKPECRVGDGHACEMAIVSLQPRATHGRRRCRSSREDDGRTGFLGCVALSDFATIGPLSLSSARWQKEGGSKVVLR